MPDDLYDRDILLWSEHQSDLLRRLSRGERVNDAVDWANVIEELESVGRSELSACESLIRHALLLLLKLYLEPDSQAASHWRGEVVSFLTDAEGLYAPSMGSRLNLDGIWRNVIKIAGYHHPEAQIARLPGACPVSLQDLLDPEIDPSALATRLVAGPPGAVSS